MEVNPALFGAIARKRIEYFIVDTCTSNTQSIELPLATLLGNDDNALKFLSKDNVTLSKSKSFNGVTSSGNRILRIQSRGTQFLELNL